MHTTGLKDIITAYRKLSFSDRIAFYSTVSNDINVCESSLQGFLAETRIKDGSLCIYCEGTHVVKNGKRKDGTQRYICRGCGRSFIPSSFSITSGTRKRLTVWYGYLRCMLDGKTLRETAEECSISVTTAFSWRHKILDGLRELTEKVYFEGLVSPKAILCTDRERAYIAFVRHNGNRLIRTGTDRRTTSEQGKAFGIQRINAYHRKLKEFIRGFHGVSTKHLDRYIIWHDLMQNSRRKREETVLQLLGQILCTRMRIYNSAVSARPPLPCT